MSEAERAKVLIQVSEEPDPNREGRFRCRARIVGEPDSEEIGRSASEAIGSLVRTCPEKFGIKLTWTT